MRLLGVRGIQSSRIVVRGAHEVAIHEELGPIEINVAVQLGTHHPGDHLPSTATTVAYALGAHFGIGIPVPPCVVLVRDVKIRDLVAASAIDIKQRDCSGCFKQKRIVTCSEDNFVRWSLRFVSVQKRRSSLCVELACTSES